MKSARDIIANSKMTSAQILGVGICMFLNALDGFDVLSISFAAPGISEDWSVDKATLGILLAIELVGMSVGSLLLGSLADKLGRRPLILLCLAIMAVGMLLAAVAPNLTFLMTVRFLTGIGIGGMLASINAMSAEYANEKNKTFAVSMMAVGYPLGAMVGGFVATLLLSHYDWRSVFWFGGALTAAMLPVVWFFLPESIEYLERKQPPGALERINTILVRLGHPPAQVLAPISQAGSAKSLSIFSSGVVSLLILMTLGYFAHMAAFFFLVKWIPQLVFEMGYAASAAGSVLVWTNAGGAVGSICFGLLSRKFPLKPLIISFLIVSAFTLGVFGVSQSNLAMLSIASACAGFFIIGTIVGFYGYLVKVFPAELRASCTGIVIGVGRCGAIFGPIVGGYLLNAGLPLSSVTLIMMFGPILAVASFLFSKPGSR